MTNKPRKWHIVCGLGPCWCILNSKWENKRKRYMSKLNMNKKFFSALIRLHENRFVKTSTHSYFRAPFRVHAAKWWWHCACMSVSEWVCACACECECACACACACVCVCVCICVCMCMFMWMCVCVRVLVHVRVHICMCALVHVTPFMWACMCTHINDLFLGKCRWFCKNF